ncbi:MAG TPA: hypothetical protein VF666_17115 [Pyrinomonadaceae bacterium]
MIAKLNLASQPFRNRTLPWVMSVAVAVVSLIALFFILAENRKLSTQADAAERDVQALQQQRNVLKAQAAEIRQAVPPDQLKTLEAANILVDRKRFSWSKLLSDLESALPSSVRVTRINVSDASHRGGQTRADLELTVVGRNAIDVTRMISEMNRGGVFSVVPIRESPKTGRGESGFEWTLRVDYVQRSVTPSQESGDDSSNSVAASNTSNTEARP